MAAKITPVVPTPRRYEASRTPPLILSGVSQETNVTDVIKSQCSSTLAHVLPTLHQAFGHLFGVQREDQMIPPVTIDVQIARPQPLGAETQLGHHPKALGVLGPDGDLDPMQGHHL